MPYDRKEIIKKHQDMKNDRAVEEPTWRELARMLRPDDVDFNANEVHSQRDEWDQFDSTPLLALDSFVGGMFGKSVNPAMRWFELGIDDEDLAKYAPVKMWLFQVTNILYASLSPATSAFYARAPAWIANLGAFGWGALYQEEKVGAQYIIDRPIPIGETYLEIDTAGNWSAVNREYRCRGDKLKKDFPNAGTGKARDDMHYTVVHSVCSNDQYDPERLGQNYLPWSSHWCSPDLIDFWSEGGYYELPYHIPTWNERIRSAYSTGPGHNIRADASMLQSMEETHLIAGQRQAMPVLLSYNEDIVSAADIVPDAVLAGAITESGKQKVQYLENRGQLQLSMAMSEQRRQSIRQGFFFSLMQIIAQRPEMTAAEFLGWSEEDLKLMAPHLTRLQTGGLSPFLARRYRILERAMQIPPPPPELAARRIAPKYVDPLARLMKVARGKGVLQAQGALEQLAVTDPTVRDNWNNDKAVQYVTDAFTEVPDVLRDPKEVDAIRAARNQAMAQQAQLQQTAQAVDIVSEASHAAQAGSLSQQRTQGQPLQ